MPKVSYEQSTGDTIKVNGTNYVIPHTIEGGKILDINLDAKSKTMIISIQSISNGEVTINLPRILIDAKENYVDTHFVVLANHHGVNFKELITTDYRDLTIPFPNGTNTIEIKGTQVIPEFGTLIPIIFAISIVITIFVSKRNKF